MQLLETLEQGLQDIDARGLRRRRRTVDSPCSAHMTVDGRNIIGFASNDYLGLAAHPLLVAAIAEGARRYGAGSGGSHLLGGHSRAHAQLEDDLAEFAGGFVDNPRALYFSTGYMANLATLTALAGRGTTLFSDSLNHASLIDGARLSRADIQIYPHADAEALSAMLEASDAAVKLIVTDTVFSMDGDIAPLARLVELAEKHGAWLVVDDAHGFGVLGPQGRGAIADAALRSPHLISIGTLGKAAGVSGAFVVAHETVIEWLVQRARPYIFTTASVPSAAHAVSASLRIIGGDEGEHRRTHLRALIGRTRDMLKRTPWLPVDSHTAVQPLIIGANDATLEIAATLDRANLWVPAIRPPTVPEGTSRLRISLSAAHSHNDLDLLETALMKTAEAAA
ncbi:8-amino-7-oxononanoate synthase [Paraburkholderia hospita]|jgi:8-amino-7-oxononanoate synthase|uniref:8-amino-7-oxononanoate synthase n=1 Tax=Paraburkholderia hospita TaxID=169430 RepID=A0AAN1J5J3_9BURK|nr:8-amino-7-oxononanoate synthase [Paraburkholderia hospita]SKC67593.1 8-amino-7-oxononanoate synthase [Burkholderia sp. CF099]SOE58754.1 8-amino-7-oxononanoate synthase [Burkholderia sp. YR290]AUT67098.1 8-amino-7-oxononanoate synthase [Paraburkholderia hospita]OUL81782.1 8-amino-7-oxononanoate synthase [Paraburkholderia hospita]SEH41781.1 8-amino-7-oxononanoate synthase [Paraburkholderia hospita]